MDPQILNNTGFDENSNNPSVLLLLSLYDMNNNLCDEIEIGVADVEFIVDQFTNECVTLPPELCVEKGTYTAFVYTS